MVSGRGPKFSEAPDSMPIGRFLDQVAMLAENRRAVSPPESAFPPIVGRTCIGMVRGLLHMYLTYTILLLDFRVMIYYDFRRGLSRQECFDKLHSCFGTVNNWFNEFGRGHSRKVVQNQLLCQKTLIL